MALASYMTLMMMTTNNEQHALHFYSFAMLTV